MQSYARDLLTYHGQSVKVSERTPELSARRSTMTVVASVNSARIIAVEATCLSVASHNVQQLVIAVAVVDVELAS